MAYVLNSTKRSRRRFRPEFIDGFREDFADEQSEFADERFFWEMADPHFGDDLVLASRSDEPECFCGPECQRPRPPRNVIYGGPCPPDPELACQPPLPPHPCDPIWYRREQRNRPGFAYYAQVGSLTAEAGEPLPLDSVVRESRCSFRMERRGVHICNYGTYLASFSMKLPAGADVDTQITMELDGETIPGSMLNVVHSPGAPGNAFVQVAFDVSEFGGFLEVVSSSPLEIIGDAPCDTLASLTLVQVDGACFDRKEGDRFEHRCRNNNRRRHCNCR